MKEYKKILKYSSIVNMLARILFLFMSNILKTKNLKKTYDSGRKGNKGRYDYLYLSKILEKMRLHFFFPHNYCYLALAVSLDDNLSEKRVFYESPKHIATETIVIMVDVK